MSVFVGRERELEHLLHIQKTATNAVVEVVGIHGIGKSRLLAQLVETSAKQEGLVVPRPLDLARFELSASSSAPPSEAAGLWETITRSREFMLRFVSDIGSPPAFDAFKMRCDEATRRLTPMLPGSDASLAPAARARDIFQTTAATMFMSDEMVCDAIRRSQIAIDDAFLDGWSEWAARRRVLVGVDGFECVLDTELGDWFMRTALRLRNTLVVLARLPVARRSRPSREGIERIDLAHFTLAEVSSYLERRFDGEAREGLAKVVYDFTAGHPGGVDLAGNLISETGVDRLTATELRRVLQRLPNDPDERWAGLVRLILDIVEDDSLRAVVDACSLVTSFEEPLLAELLGAETTGVRAGDAIGTLMGYGILKELPLMSGERRSNYSLHEFIRITLARDLRSRYPGRAEELDRRAAQYYFRELQAWDDAPSASYGTWYRYEDPDYQLFKRRWLRHAAQLSSSREITRARFLLVWLQAFWWWGYYHPFEFTYRLIDEWVQSAATAEPSGADAIADSLTFILHNYPPGHLKRDAPWDEIRNRLLRLRDLCGLRKGPPPGLSEDETTDLTCVSALLMTFLAHTRRYRDPADPAADRYFTAALDAFEKVDDQWNVAWLLYESADLQIDRGDAPGAIDLGGRAAAVLNRLATRDGEWDEELVANLARVRADAYWLQGCHEDAFELYAVAVRHAYRFQGDHDPDGYTQRFYGEIAGRACERLVELFAGAPQEALAGAATLNQGGGDLPGDLGDLLAQNDQPQLAMALFFPAPEDIELRSPTDVAELRAATSAFMDRWRVFDEDAPETAADMQALLPVDGDPGA